MTMTAKANAEMREILTKLLGDQQPFSVKGLHYLACRLLGSKYRKPISVAINAMREGRLQEMIPDELKKQIASAFSYEDSIPDPALVIIGTGRRAIKSNKGWDEAGYSLLNPQPIPENIETFEKKLREKMIKQTEIRLQQQKACEGLMALFNQQQPILTEPEVVAEEKVAEEKVAEEKPVKTAKVIKLKTPKAKAPETEQQKVKKPRKAKPQTEPVVD